MTEKEAQKTWSFSSIALSCLLAEVPVFQKNGRKKHDSGPFPALRAALGA